MNYKIVAIAALAISTTFTAIAQDAKVSTSMNVASPEKAAVKSPRITTTAAWGQVSYGMPSKNGRKIFGELVPYGEVWRTGANMSTEITFLKDINVAGNPVKAGTYSLFTIPNEKEWTIILNPIPNQKGTADYEINKSKNVLETNVNVKPQVPRMEKLNFMLSDDFINIAWDDVSVRIPLSVN